MLCTLGASFFIGVNYEGYGLGCAVVVKQPHIFMYYSNLCWLH